MTCPECGNTVAENATFCPSCGEMILAHQPTPPPAAPTPPPEPQVVPVPQRPTQQPPQQQPGRRPPFGRPRSRTRVPAPPPPQQPAPTGGTQGGYRVPQGGQWGGQGGGYPQGGYQQPQQGGHPQGGYPQGQQGGYPQGGYGEPQLTRSGPGCGTMLLRLMALLLAIPVILGVAGYLLSGRALDTGSTTSASSAAASTAASSDDIEPATAASDTAPPTATTAATATSGGIDSAIESAIGTSAPAAGGSVGAYPVVRITGRECARSGTGPYAAVAAGNDATTCAFAAAVQKAYLAANGGGRAVTVSAYSQARGATVSLACGGGQPARCVSQGGALVYLYGGQAAFA